MFRPFFRLFLIISLLVTASCTAPEKMKQSQYLLNKNIVKIDNSSLPLEELEGFIQQKPNDKALGLFRINTWIHNHSSWQWLRTKWGQAPVILDTALVLQSARQIALYMAAKGFFHAKVERQIHYKRRSANAKYIVHSGVPYTLKTITYEPDGEELAAFIFKDTASSLIRRGGNYDAYVFDSERTRITNYLRDNGYYYFNRDFIFFRLDSNLNSRQMNLTIEFRRPKVRDPATGKIHDQDHKRYIINDILFNTEAGYIAQNALVFDTLVRPQYPNDPSRPYHYKYLYQQKLRLSPALLSRQILTKGGEYYQLSNFNTTFSRLSNLPATRVVNISFDPLPYPSASGDGLLNCHIQIGQSTSQVFSVETEGTNTGGFLGIGGNIVYRNRNLLRGAEVLTIKIKGALEMQKTIGDPKNVLLGFNTVETGIEARLEIPRLLAPEVSREFSKFAIPRTTLTTGLNYQQRPDYTRYIANASFGYEWRESQTRTHLLIPVELNSVRIFRSDEFTRWLNSLTDKRLINQYTDHLVPLLRYSYVFNNQPLRKNRDFIFFRAGIESSGAMVSLFDGLFKAPKDAQGYYTLFNIRYAQFAKAEADLRYYKTLGPKSNLVFRTTLGLGKPYGNSGVLPVEKGFYAGGANGMRGWALRSLGPGRFSDPQNEFDRMGEMWMETNIEYRFPIYNWFYGALFADAGNIWMLRKNPDLPGGEFIFSDLPYAIGIDSGVGIRLDLSFFILRVDGAIRLKDPALDTGRQWTDFSSLKIRDITWNFGIGYPF